MWLFFKSNQIVDIIRCYPPLSNTIILFDTIYLLYIIAKLLIVNIKIIDNKPNHILYYFQDNFSLVYILLHLEQISVLKFYF